MLPQVVTRPLDLHDDGVVKQAIEKSRRDDGIAEHLAPFGEATIGREAHRALFVARVDELEEEVAAAGNDRQIADLVDHQERRSSQEADTFAQRAFVLGLGQGCDDIGQRGKGHALAGLHGFYRRRRRQMAFSGAGRSEEMNDFRPIDELQFGEREDAIAVE